MIEHTYQVLGYYRLLDFLSGYASCELGRSDCLSLKPSNDLQFIDDELRLVSEMRLLLKSKGFLPFSDLTDIRPALNKSMAQGSCLEPNELLCILQLAEAGQEAKKFLRSNRLLCPRMCDLMKNMPGCEDLVKILKDTVSASGEIKDTASPALKKIRERKIQFRLDIQKKLEKILKSRSLSSDGQDSLVTVRDGRYVIAVRTDQKPRIDGVVHGYSQTRATCFLEPVEAVRDNNRAAELSQEEMAEERRILGDRTRMVRDLAADLKYSQSLISRLDGLYARGRFSEALSCTMPEMGEKAGVELKGTRNAILLALALDSRKRNESSDPSVPVDILLGGNRNVLIISGPNRGGKTVTLKTLGLLSLMAQAGIHIPAEEGSRLPVFNEIMADIGDDQDIQAGLSTFSAHAAYLRYIIEHAGQTSLIIIDEPGIGTDPDEGVALAMAVMDFLSQQGAFVAVSTHFNRLKSYGLLNHRAVNASVQFDGERHCPTFKLEYGSPGISHALEVARDMGVRSDVLERAEGYLDRDEVRLNRLIEKMNRLVIETARERRVAEEVKLRYHAAVTKIEDRLRALEAEKKALMEAKRVEAEAAIKEAGDELKRAINLLKRKEKAVQAHVTETYAKTSRELMEHFVSECNDKSTGEPDEIEEGQLVYHTILKQKGVVQTVDPSGGRALVALGKVKIHADIHDLEVIEDARKSSLDESAESVSWDLKGSPPKELNVIGYRVEDAITLIDKTIDRALVDGHLSIKIIHGFGTGRLRGAIRTHLEDIPSVRHVCSADPRFGGDAITIVELV